VPAALVTGSFDWAVSIYKQSPKYKDLPQKTRDSYDDALRIVSRHELKGGGTVGKVMLSQITLGAADKLFAKIRDKADGRPRTRTAVMCMKVSQRAWNVAYRDKPRIVPEANPFAKMGLTYKAKSTRPATFSELLALVAAADKAGMASMGTAAMIAYFWLQREEDILKRLTWQHYKPAEGIASIYHHKTRELVDVPLFDDDGTALWPELMDRLDASTRHGTLICTRDAPDRWRKVHLPWTVKNFQHRVADVRTLAGIDSEVKFMGLRHGGNTEGGDAGLSDAQLRALSGHRSPNMVVVYARETMRQRREGARKRLAVRTKGGSLSE
jgi:hypothetical protein